MFAGMFICSVMVSGLFIPQNIFFTVGSGLCGILFKVRFNRVNNAPLFLLYLREHVCSIVNEFKKHAAYIKTSVMMAG